MSHNDDKEFQGGFHTKGVSEEVKEKIKKKQKDFSSQQVADMSSELTKLHRKFKSGSIRIIEYEQGRRDIYKKYDITKDERIRYLGKKFAS